MKVSYNWLQDYIEKPLPVPDELANVLTMHAFEVEGIDKVADDFVLDIDVLPNRAHDCLSHVGIAREVALLTSNILKLPETEVSTDISLKSADHLTLDVEDARLVRRATKRLVEVVKVAQSPDWLKKRLEALGQKPINNVVDITNFVMLETGQPVHAFDFDKLASSNDKVHITVRGAKKGERITTLDGTEYELEAGMLVISDDKKVLDIAGVKGGVDSGIDEHTTCIVISVCNFEPTNIRKTSRKLNLVTEASKRFENEITPEFADVAMERVSALIQEYAGGRVSEDIIDIYPKRRNPYLLGVSTNEVNKLLGTDLSDDEVEKVLNKLNFSWKKVKPIDVVLNMAPEYIGVTYKLGSSISYDSPNTFDCSSFVGYILAHAGIALPRISVEQFLFCEPVEEKNMRQGDLIFAKGKHPYFYKETPEGIGHLGIYLGEGKVIHASGKEKEVVVENYKDARSFSGENFRGVRRISHLDEERYVVTAPSERLDLHSGNGFLVSGNKEDIIEEIARVYGYNKIQSELPNVKLKPKTDKVFYYTNKIRDILVKEGFSEVYTYTLQKEGEIELANPLASDKKFLRPNIYNRGFRDSLLLNSRNADLLGFDDVRIFEIGKIFTQKGEELHLCIAGGNDTESAVVKLERELGAEIERELKSPIVEINLGKVIEKFPEPKSYGGLADVDTSGKQFEPISPYPFVLRDISVWLPKNSDKEELLNVIKNNAGNLLVNTRLFDEYEEDGRVSYAFNLVFQSQEKTLSDEEVNKVMDGIYKKIRNRKWKVR